MKPIAFILLFLYISCSPKVENQTDKSRDLLLSAYVELLKQDNNTTKQTKSAGDSSRILIKEQLLQYKDYKSAVAYLNEKPEHWQKFFQDAERMLTAAKNKPDSLAKVNPADQ